MPAVRVTAPGMSNERRPAERGAVARAGSAAPATSSASAIGHGQQERPAPAELGEQAAGHEAEREAARAGRGVDAQRPVALRALGETGGDDRQPGGRGEGGGDALEEAGDDEQRAVADEAAERRRDGEDGERDRAARAGGRAGRRRGRRAAGSRRSPARSPRRSTAAARSQARGRHRSTAAPCRPSRRRARRGRARRTGRPSGPRPRRPTWARRGKEEEVMQPRVHARAYDCNAQTCHRKICSAWYDRARWLRTARTTTSSSTPGAGCSTATRARTARSSGRSRTHDLGVSEYEVLERLARRATTSAACRSSASGPPEPERALPRRRPARARRPGHARHVSRGPPRHLRLHHGRRARRYEAAAPAHRAALAESLSA